jgi:plastocyanin
MRRLCAVTAPALALGVVACGGDDEESSGGGAAGTTESTPAAEPTSLELAASEDGGLGFDPGSLTARSGEVTITMANPDGNEMPHNVALEGGSVKEAGEVVQAGGSSTVTATLEPGEYTFYCVVGRHRQNGMEGTLTVE